MYHGIVFDQEFEDPKFPQKFKVFAKRKSSSSDWVLYGIEVNEDKKDRAVSEIQKNMKSNEPFYAHLYNDSDLIVIFKTKVFYVKPHISSWNQIIEYGRKQNIPEEQLDFWPNRFQDESHYFNKEDFVK